ncbi:D-Ala-D-Ala carboxypeptidase family metallohydrolase [Pelomonas sp. Root1444]|uniref:D-Ala-D-Ala carboxypeptidase family metallohydrolase n=1 Tax=Pelomonas sp. Root1444 TaxID=1736464 RepID=UPI000702A3AA|nr:D-Ala-D-Ala carboxypeptidase family metallohydrolase [Pelomonas sp. Root1444]KQY83643.1 hypothetical protein ASD35_24270 [Pelomonas sp. Root1444]
MITVNDYFMGRREQHPLALTPDIERRAERTVSVVNALLAKAMADGIHPVRNPNTGSAVSSGWRPPAINAATSGAAVNSRHMTGEAVDLYDPDGDIDDWLLSPNGQAALASVGLWMEHPSATKGWAHLQTVPPRSRNRVFYP